MSEIISKFQVRPASLADFPQVIEFMQACDVAEFGEPDTDEGDVTEQWETADLSQDAWLATEASGSLCGYALIEDTGTRGLSFDLYSLPTENSRQAREVLLARVLQRAHTMVKTNHTLTTYVNGLNRFQRDLLEKKGFQTHTFHYRMQIDFDAPREPVQWPQGYHLQAVTAADEAELYQLINAAFDWPGHEPVSFTDWKKHLFRDGRYDPEYFILVKKEGKLMAAALSYNEGQQGWVRQLAVSKEMQGQGLGSLLLRHVFSVYAQNGARSVALGVESANEKAAHFYEALGMYRSREFVEYRLQVD